MENWHLFTAAFVLSLVDLSVLGAFLWYQFSTLYFAWHLCPMIVNRICELIAFVFTGGMLPSLFAIFQVPLSLFSTTIYANRQQHVQNKLLLAVYCTLLLYEFLVAVLMIKMGRYLKCPRLRSRQITHPPPSQQVSQPYIAFHMFALFTQPVGPGFPYLNNPEQSEGLQAEGFVTVQQPDGKKVMLGKVLQSKGEPLQITEGNCVNSCTKPSQATIDDFIIDVLDQLENPVESVVVGSTSNDVTEQSIAHLSSSSSGVTEQSKAVSSSSSSDVMERSIAPLSSSSSDVEQHPNNLEVDHEASDLFGPTLSNDIADIEESMVQGSSPSPLLFVNGIMGN